MPTRASGPHLATPAEPQSSPGPPRSAGPSGVPGGSATVVACRSVLAHRRGAGVDKTPASAGHCPDSPGQLAAKGPDDEVTYPADHEQESDGIPDEPRHADHEATDEDHDAIEQFAGRHLPQRQSFPGVSQDGRSDTADDERPERAHEDQEHQGPQESNLLGHEDEGGDFRGDDEHHADEEHNAG